MGENTKIGWCDHTCNLWHGCVEVHRGCDACYAKALDRRYGGRHWGARSPRRYIKSALPNLQRWQRKAKALNTTHRVFVGSMMDIFELSRPTIDGERTLPFTTHDLRNEFFDLLDSNTWSNLDFLLLTKRPRNISKLLPGRWLLNGAPKNVIFGVSVVDSKSAQRDIKQLVKSTPSNNLIFLSVEPQLERIDLTFWLRYRLIDWVIVGGESGPRARKFDICWAEDIIRDCTHYGIPVFMKQIGSNPYDKELPFDNVHPKGTDPSEWPQSLRVQQFYKHKEIRIDYGG